MVDPQLPIRAYLSYRRWTIKGILFQNWKVRTIAANPDKEWQTRRIIKPQPELDAGGYYWNFYSKDGGRIRVAFRAEDSHEIVKYAPYQPGIVYIKEAWWEPPKERWPWVLYKAAYSPKNDWPQDWGIKWHSPMSLKAKDARYFIKILNVQACQTRDITPEDCFAEGIISTIMDGYSWPDVHRIYSTPQLAYFALFDSINGLDTHERGWVWKYSLIKVDKPMAGQLPEG